MGYALEIIGFSIDACRIAQAAGANRIELCDGPADGGTTPSYGFIKKARQLLSIELYAMIRPRGGDFFYTPDEFDIMRSDVQVCKELGCDGVVFGLLNSDGSIDKKRTAQLVELAYPMGVTFHRAFDRCANPFEALEHIIDCGCERILTSGLQPSAVDGASLLNDLVRQANNRIIIMPGSGVKSNNLLQLARLTGATEFHASARAFANSRMDFTNPLMNEQLLSITANRVEIEQLVAALNGYKQQAYAEI